MIRGYVGWVGAGKTYSMVHDALEQFRETRCQVFTNMAGLKFPGAVYVEDLEAITRVGTGLVLIDEVGICMSSRYWQSVPRSVLMAFAQVRKNGLDVFWTAQHEARVDTVLRELTMEVRRCRRFGRYSFQSLEDPVAKVSLGKRLVKLKQEVFAVYDTLEIIGTHGGGGGHGPIGGGLQVPRTVRAHRAKDGAEARRKQKQIERVLNPEPVRWYDRRGGLTEEAREALHWLRSEGHLTDAGEPRLEAELQRRGPDPGGNWLEVVRRELKRRAWLQLFGLDVEDVPYWCSPMLPWAEGWSPVEVEARKEREGVVAGRK